MDSPWSGDACSLVDAFRAGDRSPVEEVQATLAAIEASDEKADGDGDPSEPPPPLDMLSDEFEL